MTGRPPAVFAVPPGADFPRVLVAGLRARYGGPGQPPERLAAVTVWLNTQRMRRRVRALFDEGPALLLPRLRLIPELAQAAADDLPPPAPPLRRRLQLTQLVRRLIALEPDLAPATAAFDLAGSLSALIDEMQGEGVGLDRIAALDVSDLSGHWARSQKFLGLLAPFLADGSGAPPDREARQRRAVEHLARLWETAPPTAPQIVAGSTGSRGATRAFMRAVARLPQGAVVLPGVDADLPEAVWDRLAADPPQEDHPQYRFAALARDLGIAPGDMPAWHPAPPPSPARNRLLSLALRPAPVTDSWRRDGPGLGDLRAAGRDMTLIEAPDPRIEALALALILRKAAEDGRRAALVTPDRMLTRRVAAALDRWGIVPDDSAGEPLRQTAAGRFLRLVAGLFGARLSAEALLVLLKHPLTASGAARGAHVLLAGRLEAQLRRAGPPFPGAADLAAWATDHDGGQTGPRAVPWAAWLAGALRGLDAVATAPLADHAARLRHVAETLAAGPEGTGAGDLWDGAPGREAALALAELEAEAEHGGDMDPAEFAALLSAILGGEVRDPVTPHPLVMIWGTLEARVQGADLVLLGGLVDGVWPEQPPPDPWLNRRMRAAAGLLSPERSIGLAAHDFQQAAAAPEVVLSRALRDAEAQTVPSRWLNRLQNLLAGLPGQNGPEALADMRARGADWLRLAAALDRPAAPEPPAMRPSPAPPVAARPARLSVTEIQTLVRDPYAIYARHVLRLKRLEPLRQQPEARLRGIVVHRLMQEVVPRLAAIPPAGHAATLLAAAEDVLAAEVPWAVARRLWLARLARVAKPFVAAEAQRQTLAQPVAFEARGRLTLAAPDFTLTARADRIDATPDGSLILYDYKTGKPSTAKQQLGFDRQLLLCAAIAEAGGFDGVPAAPVAAAVFLGLDRALTEQPAPLDEAPVPRTLAELAALIAAWQSPGRGYTARIAQKFEHYAGDYDHLSRHGEWDLGVVAVPQPVGGGDGAR